MDTKGVIDSFLMSLSHVAHKVSVAKLKVYMIAIRWVLVIAPPNIHPTMAGKSKDTQKRLSSLQSIRFEHLTPTNKS